MREEAPAATARHRLFQRLWPVLKWGLFALVIAFVGRRAWQLWREGDFKSVTIDWPWLVVASVLYLAGWLPSVLFWHRLIHNLGGSSSRWDVARAYFAGHLAKYIPGKASVLLLRMELLASRGCRRGVSALTSTYEVLVCMGVGAAVGLTLAPIVWPQSVIDRLPSIIRRTFERPLIFGIGVVIVCVVLVPLVARILGMIARKLTPLSVVPSLEPIGTTDKGPVESVGQLDQPAIQIGGSFLLGWCFFAVTTWLAHGLSLGCTLKALGVSTSLTDWLAWTGDISSASFLGFAAVFAPGGLGVREAALLELLQAQPAITQAQAVAATILLRATWLAAEIVMTLALSGMQRK